MATAKTARLLYTFVMAIATCLKAYAETRALYELKAPELEHRALGFRILYGPPTVGAPLLFLGEQPGGNVGPIPSEHEGWPPYSDYARQGWRLASQVRSIWPAALVERSTGLNANFFRAPNRAVWKGVSHSTRVEIETFCLHQAKAIVGALVPTSIVVIGLQTFDKLSINQEIAVRRNGRALVKTGELWGRPAYGVIHLSGARLSADDSSCLRDYFR